MLWFAKSCNVASVSASSISLRWPPSPAPNILHLPCVLGVCLSSRAIPMAEILATMVVGPLLSMVKEKASSYLLEQYDVMEGTEEQHKVLKRKLPAILDVIADAEKQAAEHREGAKAWLEAVKTVSYQANDVFDEFKYEALRRKAKKEGHYRKLGMDVIKLFPTHNRIVFRYRMGNKLRLILHEFEVLIAEMNAFQFKFQPQQELSMKWRQTDSKIVDPMEIASRSRAADKQKMIDALLTQENNVNLTVLPIVGMGGLGKTTLAQLVYNDSKIREHFQLLLWVCVSDNFDVDFLARNIVELAAKEKKNGSVEAAAKEKKNGSVEAAAKEKKNGSETDTKPALDKLREVVSGKRYLLVLDDVWNRDASQWEKLKSSLQHGGMGSCVLTTTRDKAIAEFMGTTEENELSFLDKIFIEEIIKTKAFTSEKESPTTKLVKMVGAMADKCSGSPLAATALGSVLRTKHSVEEWEAVLRCAICDQETGILPILKLSYNVLSPEMRQCFAFCSMFPKDYEIDVEMLIQLWMGNGFILEEKGLCLEIRGKQIFTELASRSFFQDVKETPFEPDPMYPRSKYGYCSRTTCKIHDLMHDVAQSAMGKECATIATGPSKSEDFPYSTRHLFVQLYDCKTILNRFLAKRSPALQTLLCTKRVYGKLQYLSKYNSIRALRIEGYSYLKPKYLHHLRYLDISNSDIKVLPEDITILYHLQTLNLSSCDKLVQLPKQMKYMAALCHLYTHGCSKLKMMPPKLGCLTSLRTLTCFVAGSTSSSCSNLGELGQLDLGDQLEVCQLENVTETEARAANLGNKKRLIELTLRWTDTSIREPQCHDEVVLEALKPHDGIKALRICYYGGSSCPAWMNTLQHMVKLVLYDCNEINKLPPLWQLPSLQFLKMHVILNLQCFCGGGGPLFTFKKLKNLDLFRMPIFETWWDINEVQGQVGPVFPEVEKLSISDCKKLTALPRASSVGVVNPMWRSAFPALKELELNNLTAIQRWEAVEETPHAQVSTFPSLEKLLIRSCPVLTTLPEASKLKELVIWEGSQQICMRAARYCITHTSLSRLDLSVHEREATLPTTDDSLIKLAVDDKEMWNHGSSSSIRKMMLDRCNFLLTHSSAPVLWSCFVQLEDLEIWNCAALVHWPENVFWCLVSLRNLRILNCHGLTGRTQQEAYYSEQSTSSVLPPRLESLLLEFCDSLVEVPTLPASLRELEICNCGKLESVLLRKQLQQNTNLGGVGDGVVITKEKSSSFSPSVLLKLDIGNCDNLQSLSVQLDCTKLNIEFCSKLKSLDELPSLESLDLWSCKSLESMPNVPQAYSSLRHLTIKRCRRLKVLPPCLKQRLNEIKDKYLDHRYTTGTWKRVIGCHC